MMLKLRSIAASAIRKMHMNDIFFFISSPFCHSMIQADIHAARERLERFCPRPGGSCIRENIIAEKPTYDLHIIIPVYNAEKYIRDCINSILSQKTVYSYKVFLIDDGSKDSSGLIIDEYAELDNFEVIHQTNAGAASARNRGLEFIDGRYVFFVDADDMLPPDTIQRCLDVAYGFDADFVEGGIQRLINSKFIRRTKYEGVFEDTDFFHYNGLVCGAAILSSKFANICYPEKTLFEDSIAGFLLYPQIKKGFHIPEYTYVYRYNPTSVTYRDVGKPRTVETYWITEQMVEDAGKLGLPKNQFFYEMLLQQIICNCKRLKNLPETVQKDVFILTCDLTKREGLNRSLVSKHRQLADALLRKDYGNYQLYCKTR